MPLRAHVVLPEDLVAEIDRVAGQRRRSRFVEQAIREKLARERMAEALEATAGSIDLSEYPEWDTPEKVSAWVDALRREEPWAIRVRPNEK